MITKEQALEALDSLDDYARMDVSVDAYGPRRVLEQYIEQRDSEFQRKFDQIKLDCLLESLD